MSKGTDIKMIPFDESRSWSVIHNPTTLKRPHAMITVTRSPTQLVPIDSIIEEAEKKETK